ncbi:hypothetical protein A3B21_03070 [Candidatus Uhrbacteria bacterium RIFCSPLOWO2_01_FULL_47_24]|uniref:Uncharacterized protein n=1 Tax=Candidatus Uhrbacteria bacterium RIFCSPLOWO2_01_FULL_47_24 TaxID=1802401 RepID=A0A1F7URJ9_9BACT|nr:MAG: hypothetical protein A2753_04995 [Candidatus Uhrbacteria bacterium RIFCSPHIGHO2_01_FULL_47_11]OGL67568.1 MAG: hypothetical protein A3D58_03670 [Candidatus Uhrbacteria bacterium RIFCSPHIGHO2_02_FULL_46_47]OGL75165.1 MAG: hypothetical protein A3F52_02685 [Candidatus Uhrbacteria bacterium RIFCSPHIGHO2_12_FULL_47_11]OGL80922.1 MAG: hypothetical protein A3B21_03070 [Candidatus Uhrbacteria bacterium RIFCSPLOWO2_01_FULL_47_24]OGL84257.1 MAG: hypothetical protein A3J03_03070 [Candidatus Uhrbact
METDEVEKVEQEVLNLLSKLGIGESVTLPGRGGWMMRVTVCDTGYDFTHRNPTDQGQSKFFNYTTVGNPYGAGKIKQEPSLGVQCRNCGVEVDGAIVGAIVLNDEGKVTARFSWSNLTFPPDPSKAKVFSISAAGELTVAGVSHGYVAAVFLADKNRLTGYVGVFKPVKPATVKVVEMETLLFASI